MPASWIDERLIEEPALFQICLGIPWSGGADIETILAMRKALLRNVNWVGFWIFRAEVPMVAQAALFGGNVQVGLEDNLFLERAVLTSNGQLVERAVQII